MIYCDGWHTIRGNRVQVKGGKVVRGVKNSIPTEPYKQIDGEWRNGAPTVREFVQDGWKMFCIYRR